MNLIIFTLSALIILEAATSSTIDLHQEKNSSQLSEDPPFYYDPLLAQDLSSFSLASYCAAAKLKNWNCGLFCGKNPEGLQDIFFMKNSTMNSAGYLGYSTEHNAIVVVFRGTVPWLIKNWISDIDFLKADYPLCPSGCQVHSGFYNAFKELVGQINQQLPVLRAKYPNAKIFVTGYSLGAAIATLSVPLIYELNQNKPIDAFYIFGSPRVGDANYSQWFSSQNFTLESGRITHNADPVPHVPPKALKFTHIDKEIFYNSSGKKFTLCGEGESNKCAQGVKFPIIVSDHISYYGWNQLKQVISCQ